MDLMQFFFKCGLYEPTLEVSYRAMSFWDD
jgi:hypothetical protein